MENIATDVELVKSRINSLSSSRNEMISSIKALENAINQAQQWQGVDAEAHKKVLLDFCSKLESCASWMEAAGEQAINHSQQLAERAINDSKSASIFD